METKKEKIQNNIEKIINLKINDTEAINIYLDAVNYMRNKYYLSFIKKGELRKIDYLKFTNTFLEYFENGEFNFLYCHDNPSFAEIIVYIYYMETIKKSNKIEDKLRFLDNLALNGSRRSKEYRAITDDKITGSK